MIPFLSNVPLCVNILYCAEGIVFSVRPPKKSWKNISNLSGAILSCTHIH